MTEGSFPRPAQRFESVGFSEIVKVRNRVIELLASGQKVWRFEGGEPWMNTPESVKAAMGDALARNQTRYAPSSGIPELRQAILAKARRGATASPPTRNRRSSSTAACTASSPRSRRC